MMLPVSVMKVMPTATQPMNEIALSSALMLICEVKPGVVSANIAIAAMADGPDRQARCGGFSCRRDRVGDVGQHALQARLRRADTSDLPAAIHADDDVGHA